MARWGESTSGGGAPHQLEHIDTGLDGRDNSQLDSPRLGKQLLHQVKSPAIQGDRRAGRSCYSVSTVDFIYRSRRRAQGTTNKPLNKTSVQVAGSGTMGSEVGYSMIN